MIAKGSIKETKYHLILAKDLGYIDMAVFINFMHNYILLGKKVNSQISSIKTK
ncbi:MAG: four helix bundle protein [Ignavibacteria bacterium]|nr:four helix bundle protein [Ignavibacteria bacterium]